MTYIQDCLFAMQDEKYREFHSKLIPNISPERVIGVRTPELRKFAKEFFKSEPEASAEFMKSLPHTYYEENNLHGFFIEQIKDYDETIAALDEFLPFVDNWATCDLMRPKVFKKNISRMIKDACRWMSSDDVYEIRFGMEMLMVYCLDDDFDPKYLEKVAGAKHDDYYVKMMIAWFFATALAKQWDDTVPYIEQCQLEPWTHNKVIQKSIESYRITKEQKEYLRGFKVSLK